MYVRAGLEQKSARTLEASMLTTHTRSRARAHTHTESVSAEMILT